MIKIAFFDVDGTLLRLGHKELSANTAAALRQLHQMASSFVWLPEDATQVCLI